jgi:formylglycine-generating enzyme required for sulfatase activity
MRAHAELLALSGYAGRPRDFDDLIRILDAETRLITPTDPEGVEPEAPGPRVDMSAVGQAALPVPAAQRFYQLSHDYLVHSLRDWLTRKQKETYRGRAELVLADRAAVWNVRPENRQLPSLWQWACIRLFSARKRWTPPQRKMMRKANWHHSIRVILVAALAVAGTAWGAQLYQQKTNFIAGFVDRLVDAQIEDVPKVIGEMASYHSSVDPKLIEIMRAPSSSAKAKLRASLALLPADPNQVDYLYGGLLDAEAGEIPVIRDALAPHKTELVDKLWAVAESPGKGKEPQRLRAACALALYDPADKAKWRKVAAPVVADLLAAALKNPSHYSVFLELLGPAGAVLVEPLAAVFRSPERSDAERRLATSLLAEFAAQDPNTLAGLLLDADAKQFAVLFPIVKTHGDRAAAVLAGAIDQPLAALADDAGKERLAKQQANAAVALLKLHEPAKAWPLLKHSSDPRARSYLIHRVAPFGVDPAAIVKRLDAELDVTARRALILSLGDFGESELSPGDRSALLPKLHDFYRTAEDAGLHASAEWLLRTWKQDALLKEAHETWLKDGSQREKRLAAIGKKLATWAALAPGAAVGTPPAPPEWYVNRQGQNMVVIPGPVKFVMGSPVTESGRNDDEPQHMMRIGRSFAIGATPVTVEQYRSFDKAYRLPAKYVRAADLPVVGTSWYQAAAYCNWLSKEEGIATDQWCFATDAKGKVTALRPNYLGLAGYRLPTEAEMEFATRAGAVTSRYYGETEELLPNYAWYLKNAQDRTWPVGSLKPNDFGLFDTHGNVFSWCQESYKPSGNEALAHEDQEDGLVVGSAAYRALRGGSFDDKASIVRSAYRVGSVPSTRLEGNGFRVARTLPPGKTE